MSVKNDARSQQELVDALHPMKLTRAQVELLSLLRFHDRMDMQEFAQKLWDRVEEAERIFSRMQEEGGMFYEYHKCDIEGFLGSKLPEMNI